MKTYHRAHAKALGVGRTIAILALVLGSVNVSCSYSDKRDDVKTAEEFIAALNAHDVETMLRTTMTPFLYQSQEWETAKDGSGFILGRIEEQIANEPGALRSLFVGLFRSVKVEQPKVVENPPSKEIILNDYLGHSIKWTPLNVYIFLRGAGDVEHIVLVGITPTSHRVVAFYVN